jgi:hypothetical protein
MTPPPDPGLAAHFTNFAAVARSRAPLYARLSAGIADSPLLPLLFEDAEGPARVPVILFAAVHDLLLADRTASLARFYPNLAERPDPGDPVPEFLDFCAAHAAAIRQTVATRLPQTNEIGRSALLLAGFDRLEATELAHLDVGASAGLNLMVDRLAYRDGSGGQLGTSAVVLDCAVRGDPHRLARALPVIGARLGLDAHPIDTGDAGARRWLEACVWPDQADRFRLLEAALELEGRQPVEVRRGDAVDDLAEAVASLAGGGHPVITTSWVLCYLTPERQQAWREEVERLGAGTDLSWVWAEAPARVDILPVPADVAASETTTLGITTWRDGKRTDRTLAKCHPHGYWLRWL